MLNFKFGSMKKILKISLLKLESLLDQEMRCLKGGSDVCWCGCHYASYGSSSEADNSRTNREKGYQSYMETKYCLLISLL